MNVTVVRLCLMRIMAMVHQINIKMQVVAINMKRSMATVIMMFKDDDSQMKDASTVTGSFTAYVKSIPDHSL